jgi:hypothetical protein
LLQRLEVTGQVVDAFRRDDLAATGAIDFYVLFEELATPHRHFAIAMAWHGIATVAKTLE